MRWTKRGRSAPGVLLQQALLLEECPRNAAAEIASGLDDARETFAAQADADAAFDADRPAAATAFAEAEGGLRHVAGDRKADAHEMAAHPLAIIDRLDREARLGMAGPIFHHGSADVLV